MELFSYNGEDAQELNEDMDFKVTINNHTQYM